MFVRVDQVKVVKNDEIIWGEVKILWFFSNFGDCINNV